MSKIQIPKFNNEKGMLVPLVLVTASVMIIFAVGLITWAISEHKDTSRKIRTTQALQIAEAGVNYYKWHLEHDDEDYQDGENWCCNNNPGLSLADCGYLCGPYDHEYKDYNNEVVGKFSLEIIPPEVGSTIAIIKSTGYAYNDENNKKKITSRVGKRSLSEYSWLSDAPMTFSATATVTGPVHSNGVIEFRGTCSAEVSSHINVWGAGGPASFWRFPVPRIDFDDFISDLLSIKEKAAQEDGTCNGDSGAERGICYESSGAGGYWVVFGGYVDGGGNAIIDGGPKVSIYRVDTLGPLVDYSGGPGAEEPNGITALLENHPMPDNGLIFLEDDVWIEGMIEGRATVGTTKFLSGEAKVFINGNIVYSDGRAGSDNFGIVCQGDIIMPRHAPDDLKIEASLLSQQGKGLFFRYYSPQIVKSRVENYGGIVTFLRAGVKYGNPVSNGYVDSLYTYNNNLTFNPPPSFPTAENFEVLSWEEE